MHWKYKPVRIISRKRIVHEMALKFENQVDLHKFMIMEPSKTKFITLIKDINENYC